MLQLLEWLNDGGERRLLERLDFPDPRAAVGEQLAYARLHVLGTDPRERWQGFLAQQRVFHESLVLGGTALYLSAGSFLPKKEEWRGPGLSHVTWNPQVNL